MKSVERQQFLLTRAGRANFVSIPDSARELQVSVETIRRDINILCSQKKLKKVHGGAVPIQAAVKKDPAYRQRFQLNPKGREAVAAAAAKMIKNGDVVTLDGGATTLLLAQHITGVENVTFVVDSLHIATTLADKLAAGEITGKLILLGGTVELANYTMADSLALQTLESFQFDMAFVSASSVSAWGVANSSLSGIFVRKLMDHSSVSILVTDSDKLGGTSTYRFASATDFDHIFVDNRAPVPQDLQELLDSSHTQLTVVPL